MNLRQASLCRIWVLAWGLAFGLPAAPGTVKPRVLVMATSPEQVQSPWAKTLADGLAAAGEDVDVVPVEWPTDAHTDADVVRHLLRRGPADLVVGVSLELAREVQRQAPAQQLLFDGFNDPRHSCVVEKLERPGLNATGSFVLAQEGEKMTDLLLDAFPQLRQVVVLVTDDELGQQPCPNEFKPRPAHRRCESGWLDDPAELARLVALPTDGTWTTLNGTVNLRYWRICSPPDIVALRALANEPHTGVVVLMRDLFYHHRELLVRTLNGTRRPAIYIGSIFTSAGGLMGLKPKLPDTTLNTLRMMRLILHGHPAGSLPVSVPRSNEIFFNRTAARAAGLVPSVSFLRRVNSFVEHPLPPDVATTRPAQSP